MRRLIATAFVLSFGVLFACDGPAKEPAGIRVVDSHGRQVTVRLPVQRIVVLNGHAAEVLRAIGAKDRIVGLGSARDKARAFWDDLAELPSVGDPFEPNTEKIVRLKPDLVIAIAWQPGPEFDRKLLDFGIQTLRLDCYQPEKVEQDIETLGRIVGCEAGAARLVEFLSGIKERVQTRLRDLPEEKRPTFYVEIYTDFACAAPQSGSAKLCTLAGGRNIFTEKAATHRPTVSAEWVIEQNPQVIVRAVPSGAGYGSDSAEELKKMRNAILDRPGFRHIDAVKNGRVYIVRGDIWLGPSCYISLCYLARYFHPDIFRDFDPRAVHIEYLKRFHGLSDPGVQAYP